MRKAEDYYLQKYSALLRSTWNLHMRWKRFAPTCLQMKKKTNPQNTIDQSCRQKIESFPEKNVPHGTF
jgi:hypothetical protein